MKARRARRVKCDEGKPACKRCIMGDRKCVYGSLLPIAKARNVITVYLPPVQNQPVFFINTDGQDFFHRNLASRLDGQFDSEFWSKLVLQLSHSEPAVRHAISAVSVLHRDVETSMTEQQGYITANPAVARELGAAIQSLSRRMADNPNSNLVPLVCCLIFTCVEFLRGNVDSAVVHVRSGFKLLGGVRMSNSTESTITGESAYTQEDLHAIEEHIVPMFSRLNAVCSLFGKVTPQVLALMHQEDAGVLFEDLTQARQRLYEAMDPAIRFIRSAGRRAEGFELTVEDFVEQVKLQTTLEDWRGRLSGLMESDTAANKVAATLLIVQYLVVHTWLMVCTTAEETAIDAYMHAFEEIVTLSEQVTSSRAKDTQLQPLSFDMQIIGPLYYTAVKCRHPLLRRRALALLKLAPRREGLWSAQHAYVIARRIIEIEERGMAGLVTEAGQVSDEGRVYNHDTMPGEYRKFARGIVPSPSMPGTIEVGFQMKPKGALGPWHTFTEAIAL